jgi:phosphoglycolate phosphatase
MKKKLIIFDMDGTLIDSGNVIANTINFVRVNLGLEKIEKYELLKQLNNPNIDSARYFYGTSSFTDEQTKLFNQYYNEYCIKDIILYDGIDKMLEEISPYFTLTIATNASIEFAEKMIKHLNIDKYFSTIVGSSCVKNPKPAPDMILKILKQYNMKQKDTILIGDSMKDKQASDNAKIDSILVDWGFSNYQNDKIKNIVSDTNHLTKKLLALKI